MKQTKTFYFRKFILAFSVFMYAFSATAAPQVSPNPQGANSPGAQLFYLQIEAKPQQLPFAPELSAKDRLKLQNKLDAQSKNSRGKERFGAESLQTFFLIMVIAGVVVAQTELEQARIEGRSIDPLQAGNLFLKAAQHVLDDGSFWTGFTGCTATMAAMKAPLQIFSEILANHTARGALTQLLASSIQSTIAFGAWEIGSQVWEDARRMLENEADFKKSEGLVSLLKGSFYNSNASDLSDQKRILAQMLKNMSLIVLVNSDLRDRMLYNAWRLRLATGDFAILVMTMASAGIGTRFVPGAGTLVAAAFGLVGGIVYVNISKQLKDRLTLFIKAGRMANDRVSLELNLLNLWTVSGSGFNANFHRRIEEAKQKVAPFLKRDQGFLGSVYQKFDDLYKLTPESAFSERKRLRNKMIDIYSEAYHLLEEQKRFSKSKISILKETIARQGTVGFKEKKDQFLNALRIASQIYFPVVTAFAPQELSEALHENENLVQFSDSAQGEIIRLLTSFYSDEKGRIQAINTSAAQDEAKKLETLDQFFKTLGQNLSIYRKMQSYRANQVLSFIEKTQSVGFDEDRLLKAF